MLESISGGTPVPDKALPMPTVDATRLFTKWDIVTARDLINKSAEKAATMIATLVVEPKMAHINKVTGQENDCRYWAYALIYLLGKDPKLGTRPTSSWDWGAN